jgi:hypothetical protein
LRALQELADPFDCTSARLTAIAQIEDESWIAHDLAPKPGRRDFGRAQEILYFSQ